MPPQGALSISPPKPFKDWMFFVGMFHAN